MSDIVEELFASDDASALTNRAAREIERLRTHAEDQERQMAIMRDALGNGVDNIVALTTRVAELEEGLKPFSELHGSRLYSDESTALFRVKIGSIRRARALLSKGGE